ncbi:MAG TPA: chemotaxis protein CheB [Myxococcota bacterium]|nr:chemotaxis protein CheB [Myxococcota bacterium]
MPVVGVGASAGGLEAFSQLLEALPANLGMAVVFVQHLAPTHESALPELLRNVSSLPVIQVSEGVRLERDHVYVIPPNAQLGLNEGQLHLSPRATDKSQYTPIDFFFRSLAESVRDRSIAIVLSGTASDGAQGIREVKAAGGITIAQRPETAKYDGMPRAAMATGMVDLTLSPREIAAALVEIAHHPYVHSSEPLEPLELLEPLEGLITGDGDEPPSEDMQQIFSLLRAASGIDFKLYKLPTIHRRLQRRMALHKLTRIDQYLEYAQDNPNEITQLYQDILIHVTRFFREPEAFGALRVHAFPEMLARRNVEAPLRVWVCGCATGEEAYSVGIELLEFLGDSEPDVGVQIFATDVSEAAIEYARTGIYPESISADVSPERLRRFFVRSGGSYRVTKMVRDLCVFARQDVTRDPPFSRLDLVLCRNVLIYMTLPLQHKLMGVFQYALKPGGFLMLGNAETIGTHSDRFATADKKSRIYAKKPTDGLPHVTFPVEYHQVSSPRPRTGVAPSRDEPHMLHSEASRILLERYAPAGVVIDNELEIVQFRGKTGPYLESPPGEPSLSLLKMAREGLLYALRTAVHSARKQKQPVRREGIRIRVDGAAKEVSLEVIPLVSRDRTHFLVLFEDATPRAEPAASRVEARAKTPGRTAARREETRVARMQQELAANRDYLQSIIQDLEAANEELQSANEEILSSNEEMQSTNEELDTAKEELQSTNEELNTVNEELHARNEELSRANSDLVNLLGSVEIAIVIVASDLRIRRFTPMAERVLNLIGSDVGRPIGHIKPNIDCPDLENLISEAIDRVNVQEIDVQDRQGNWFSLRIRPYKNIDNRIDGAVLSLFDINTARIHEREIAQARHYAQAVVETVTQPLVLLDRELVIRTVNQSFCDAFGYRRKDLESKRLFEIGGGSWDLPLLRAAVDTPAATPGETLAEGSGNGRDDGNDVEISPNFPRLGTKRLRVSVRHIDAAPAQLAPAVLLAIYELPEPSGYH